MTTNAIKERPRVAMLSDYMGKLKAQMGLALPKHLNADRMTRLVLTQFSTTPALQDCTFESIAAAAMTASQLGLEIGVNGQAYMIPYGRTATFVPGWKGLVDLVSRAGRASVWTSAVFEGDDFDWELGDSPRVRHRPAGENDPDKMLFAYAVGRVVGAEWPVIEVWSQSRLRKHFAKYNKVGKKHYAHDNWEMYSRKVVLLQVLKYMPQSIELSAAIELSQVVDHGTPATLDADFVVSAEQEPDSELARERAKDAPPTSLAGVTGKISRSFDMKAFEEALAGCETPDAITALCRGLDRNGLSQETNAAIDRMTLERETEILKGPKQRA